MAPAAVFFAIGFNPILGVLIANVRFSEVNQSLGEGGLVGRLVDRRPPDLQLGRHERPQTLIQLSRLTGAIRRKSLADGTSPPHAELVQLLRGLAKG